MTIAIEEAREWIEEQFIGFSPNTNNVKPVHIANGMFRAVLGGTVNTRSLHRFVFSRTDKGRIPRGHELEKVYSTLINEHRLDSDEVSEANIARLRELLKKVVAADDAVFTDGMESYSAGFVGFVSKDRIGQDGGELISEWLRRNKSPLRNCISDSLKSEGDTITLLSAPLLDTSLDKSWLPRFDFDRVRFLNKPIPSEPASSWEGLVEAANTLCQHLSVHPNKLFRLRLSVLFASYVLVRHLASLEVCYVPRTRNAVLPFLLDFSPEGTSPVARASAMTYTLVCQSIARFYAWGFGKYLQKLGYNYERLRRDDVPVYKKGQVKKGEKIGDELKEIWKLALRDAKDSKQLYTICGQALYDMLALQSNVSPIGYLRQLGHRSGLLYPPVNTRPTKRFMLQQDMLETLVRGAVRPGEVIDMPTLQERFWTRYGLIVGGRQEDEEKLLKFGIYQADSNSLDENRKRFADSLSRLGFADLLADGVLQVKLEGSRAI
jgi:hypothetical protein